VVHVKCRATTPHAATTSSGLFELDVEVSEFGHISIVAHLVKTNAHKFEQLIENKPYRRRARCARKAPSSRSSHSGIYALRGSLAALNGVTCICKPRQPKSKLSMILHVRLNLMIQHGWGSRYRPIISSPLSLSLSLTSQSSPVTSIS
jgi:hypothetical protein